MQYTIHMHRDSPLDKLAGELYPCFAFLAERELELYAAAFDAAGAESLESLKGKTVEELRSETFGMPK